MKALGSVGGVVAAMRDDASVEVERIEREGAAQADRILGQPPPRPGDPDGDPRVVAARRAAEEVHAAEDWADARAIIEARERFLEEVVSEGRKKLTEPEDAEARRAWLSKLVHEAMERLGERSVVVEVASGDAPLFDKAKGSAAIEGGCVVRTQDGRTWFDNTIGERERRFEPQWRALLARTYWP